MPHHDAELADRAVPGPHTYLRVTVEQLWENSPLLLAASFLFTLLCAPALILFVCGLFFPSIVVGILTIPAAWAGLLALEADIVREAKTGIGVLFKALRRYWARSVILGLPAGALALMALYTLPLLAVPQASGLVWPGLFADASLAALVAAAYLYAFPLLALHDLGLPALLRNAALLASRHISNTVGLLSIGILFAMAIGYLLSGLLFFLPAVWGVFIVNNCRMVVREESLKADTSPGGAVE